MFLCLMLDVRWRAVSSHRMVARNELLFQWHFLMCSCMISHKILLFADPFRPVLVLQYIVFCQGLLIRVLKTQRPVAWLCEKLRASCNARILRKSWKNIVDLIMPFSSQSSKSKLWSHSMMIDRWPMLLIEWFTWLTRYVFNQLLCSYPVTWEPDCCILKSWYVD